MPGALPIPLIALDLVVIAQAVLILRAFPGKLRTWQPRLEDLTRTAGSSRRLAKFRCIVGFYSLGLSLIQGFWAGWGLLAKWFTMWTWWLMTAYFLVGAWLSWRDVRGEAPDGALLALSPRLAFWMVAAFHILGTMALVLTGMTWTLLLPSAYSLPDAAARAIAVEGICNFGSYNQHGMNVVFMLIEGWLADIPVIPSMAGVVSGWAAIYTTFAVIRYMIVGKYIYGVLDCALPQQWARTAFVYGLHWLAFGTVLALSWIKGRIRKGVGSEGVHPPGPGVPHDGTAAGELGHGLSTEPRRASFPMPSPCRHKDASGVIWRNRENRRPACDPHPLTGLHVAAALQLGNLRTGRRSSILPGHRPPHHRAQSLKQHFV
ncbi:hypothetical protein ACKKBF_B17335 [Auxenochlorella protothecoides x Auxenochlorella symbiontica]